MRASAFLNKAAGSTAKKAPRKAPQLSLVSTSNELYIFNDDANGSHIIMSSDERMPEVLGYSYEGTIDSDAIPCNMQAWLDDCAAQVRWLREHPEAAAERRKSPQRADIAPMLTCQFNQGYPYNLKCPEVDEQLCVTGCVATAMAQIMHYWQWPKKTTFTIPAYTTNTLKIEMPAIPPRRCAPHHACCRMPLVRHLRPWQQQECLAAPEQGAGRRHLPHRPRPHKRTGKNESRRTICPHHPRTGVGTAQSLHLTPEIGFSHSFLGNFLSFQNNFSPTFAAPFAYE